MKLGVFIHLTRDVEKELKKVNEMGFETCQLNAWDLGLFNDEMVEAVVQASNKYNVEIISFWCGWEGPQIWNFYEGPNTLGLVPEAYRFERLKEIGYDGPLTIEREISGDQQIKDILMAKEMLEKLI